MKIKTIVILSAVILAIGAAFVAHSTGSCPMQNAKPCQWFSK